MGLLERLAGLLRALTVPAVGVSAEPVLVSIRSEAMRQGGPGVCVLVLALCDVIGVFGPVLPLSGPQFPYLCTGAVADTLSKASCHLSKVETPFTCF